ncbi:threonine dehydratase [Sphingopyxis sp. H038]|nr:threonine dehydratase [Sphingopyxis sp. H012]KTE10818.1 threonine dehydratase [Sphingopyxis sp. H093]KTE13457.1 threonine dehydratase [Sphingopyxis sp. H053]KTE31296.1 threonine dehydratase [Sphingopyxis sp. H080]KTE36832.1 threonine dehydratase [Sphingopyxis sp. H038]KTE47129.1 threonine dehydratase [Sphingopyxis sp. H005]KTE48360.1 threonine dehydratase [Sphingopyxis sp. H077]KTE71549.1 threonine dehydratase [Sphingopyxis sp. H085]
MPFGGWRQILLNERVPTFADIEAAATRMAGQIAQTPCAVSHTLSRICGCEIFLKFENHQFTASFKERGALNKLLGLLPREKASGVVAMSAGNHAQGVAYHAARLGIRATIVMPEGTPLTKIARTREHGAKVFVSGANLVESYEVAEKHSKNFGLTMIHPYDDGEVIAGQGTLGIEICRAVEALDVIVVPVGGGGLVSGVAIAAKAINPQIKVIGVQSSVYPSMARAMAGEEGVLPDGVTIAEGIAVKVAGALTRRIVAEFVDEILVVEEASIERAIALLQSVEKTVCEGAGAAGLAAVLEHKLRFAGMRVAVPLTGGNIDARIFANVILRDLIRSGALMRIDVPISDQPGALATLATLLAGEGANIVDVAHERMSLALNPKRAALDLVVELQDSGHGTRVIEALRSAGFEASARAIG